MNHYSDNGSPFISQEKPQNGTFSGPRSQSDPLRWYVVVTDEDVSFVVYYYGTVRAERTVSALCPVYVVRAADENGNVKEFTGRLYSDRIMIDEGAAFRSLMRKSKYLDLSFEMVNGDKLSYEFSRMDLMNFNALYAYVYEGRPYEESLPYEESAEKKPAPWTLPHSSLAVTGGYYIPFGKTGNIRTGLSAVVYPLQGNVANLGLRADVSVFTFSDGKNYPELDASLAVYTSFFTKGRLRVGFEVGAGGGYLWLDEDYEALLVRFPAALTLADHSGWQISLECLTDLCVPSFKDWGDLDISLCPSLTVRYGF